MYYKANRKVAEFLQLTAERNETRDGNYILWVADINRFGSLAEVDKILANIGAVAIHPKDVKNELFGITNTPLPTALDERFVIAKTATGAKSTESDTSEAEISQDDNLQADTTESVSEVKTTNTEEE